MSINRNIDVDVEAIRKKVYGWCLVHPRNAKPTYEEIVEHQQNKCAWCHNQVENFVRHAIRFHTS